MVVISDLAELDAAADIHEFDLREHHLPLQLRLRGPKEVLSMLPISFTKGCVVDNDRKMDYPNFYSVRCPSRFLNFDSGIASSRLASLAISERSRHTQA